MSNASLPIILSLLLAATSAERTPPPVLLGVLRCLASKGFVEFAGKNRIRVAYVEDDRSYPGEKVVYLVRYTTPDRLEGELFAVFREDGNGGRGWSIENNATFRWSGNGTVSFTNPPLGGVWTQEHLVSAVKQMASKSTFNVGADDLRAVPAKETCRAYTDPK
jgi:hypothetical protein